MHTMPELHTAVSPHLFQCFSIGSLTRCHSCAGMPCRRFKDLALLLLHLKMLPRTQLHFTRQDQLRALRQAKVGGRGLAEGETRDTLAGREAATSLRLHIPCLPAVQQPVGSGLGPPGTGGGGGARRRSARTQGTTGIQPSDQTHAGGS